MMTQPKPRLTNSREAAATIASRNPLRRAFEGPEQQRLTWINAGSAGCATLVASLTPQGFSLFGKAGSMYKCRIFTQGRTVLKPLLDAVPYQFCCRRSPDAGAAAGAPAPGWDAIRFAEFSLLLLIVALQSVAAGAQPAPAGPPAVGVVRAERQQITHTDEFIGRIQAIGRVALVARVSAFLEKRQFVEGAEVKKGDILYLLEQPPYQAQVDADKATVAQLAAQHTFAAQQLGRAQYLLKTPAGQQQNVDQTLSNERSLAAQVDAAKAQLETAEINLGYTE